MSKPSTPTKFSYSRIKDITIPLFNYGRFHRPSSEYSSAKDIRLIERGRLLNIFTDLLSTKMFSGTYLVAGFRGVGKTSLVKEALLRFRRSKRLSWFPLWLSNLLNKIEWNQYSVIDINLSHKGLSAFDILKSMAWTVHDRYSRKRLYRTISMVKLAVGFITVLYFANEGLSIAGKNPCLNNWCDMVSLRHNHGWIVFSVKVAIAVVTALLYGLLGWDISHRKNIRRLKLLLDRINSSVKRSHDIQAGSASTLGVFRRGSEKLYRELNDKEISYELIEIINAASYGRYRFKSRFIFVIDELDKIESVLSQSTEDTFPSDHLRKKREKIFELVGEMKYFFTMARAKFFFVTGSEMYDAALADVTERDSYLGSIFNHVIYVPSFLTDFNNQSSNITEQTENLLCKFLVDPKKLENENKRTEEQNEKIDKRNKEIEKRNEEIEARNKEIEKHNKQIRQRNEQTKGNEETLPLEETIPFLPNLKSLNHDRLLLADYFNLHHPNKSNKDNSDDLDSHVTDELIKLYYILSSYINFLALRSKGSPKKIIALIEDNLVQGKHINEGRDLREYYLANDPRLPESENISYLIFDEVDQFKIGLTAYLYSPFLYSYSSFIANHSDKLILSSAFIWDHIYKYHNAAFSVHHLEYIYELTAISKEPEIKSQLTFLLSLMKSRHLRDIRSGIFEYKFFSRISNEIKFLSNIVQAESAAFNFTLDESFNLKRYYLAQLESAKKDMQGDTRNPFIRGFLSRIIGDLHFFDKEYDKAILYYEGALKYFHKIDPENFSNGELANLVRWLLLLSLAYEKSGHYVKSFAICKDIQNEFKKLRDKHSDPGHFDEILLYSKIPYAHILQKLVIIEKTGLNGLNGSDIQTAYGEIAEIYGGSYSNESNELKFKAQNNLLIKSEINFKIVNILFYRNTELEHGLLPPSKHFANIGIPYMAGLYMQCIIDVLRPASKFREITDVLDLTRLKSFCSREGPNYYSALADYFSKAGNSFITHFDLGSQGAPDEQAIREFFENLGYISSLTAVQDVPESVFKNKYFMAARFMYTSATLSEEINDGASESAQYLKLLYLIRNLSSRSTIITDVAKQSVIDQCEGILNNILKLSHTKNENLNRLYVQKYKERLHGDKKFMFLSQFQHSNRTQLIKSFPDAPDGIEALIVYYEILTKFDNKYFDRANISNFTNTVSEHSIVQSQYLRVMELYFKVRCHYYTVTDKRDEDQPDAFRWIDGLHEKATSKNVDVVLKSYKEIAKYSRTALDSIYCLVEILRLLNIQRNSFINGYSYTGNFYHRLGWWIIFKKKLDWVIAEVIKSEQPNVDPDNSFRDLEAKLSSLFDVLVYDSTVPMLAKYHLEMAIAHFTKAKQTHRRGQPYREALNSMYTMDDDFNDDFSHFQVAIERMSINSDHIKSEIENCNQLLKIIRSMEDPLNSDGKDWMFDFNKF